jgi:tetratricopeptide (TPR) repeat protein
MSKSRLEILKDMLALDTTDSFVRYALAKEYESLSDHDSALNEYLILMKNDANYVGMYYHLAKLYEKLENYDKAMETYNLGVEIAKKNKDFHALSELNSAKLNLEMEL